MHTLVLKENRKGFHSCVYIVHTSNKYMKEPPKQHFIGTLGLLQFSNLLLQFLPANPSAGSSD